MPPQASEIVEEPHTGAWQRNIVAFIKGAHHPLVTGAIHRIASDIALLPFRTRSRVVKKPNKYQTTYQFFYFWISQLLWTGDAYIIPKGDEIHVASSKFVTKNSVDGYNGQWLYFVEMPLDSPNSIINGMYANLIHDRFLLADSQNPLFTRNPLKYLFPFTDLDLDQIENASRIARNPMQKQAILQQDSYNSFTQDEIKKIMQTSGARAFIGDDSKLQQIDDVTQNKQDIFETVAKSISAIYGIPLPQLLGTATANEKILNDEYYYNALLPLITSIKQLLATINIKIEFDVSILLDEASEMLTLNEKRLRYGLEPLVGGDTVYMQQQYYPLEQIMQNKINNETIINQNPVETEREQQDEETENTEETDENTEN